jgi:hypothetical protein
MNYEVFITEETPREHSVAIFVADSEAAAEEQVRRWLKTNNMHKTFTVAETDKRQGWWMHGTPTEPKETKQ